MHGYWIGTILGGVIWFALLFTLLISWAMGFAPESGIWRNVVFLVIGLGGFLACAFLGGRLGVFIEHKIKHRR